MAATQQRVEREGKAPDASALPRSAKTSAEGARAVLPLSVRDDFDRDVWSVLGLPIDRSSPPEAVEAVRVAARDRQRLSIVTPNVNFLVRAHADAAERRAILNADLSLADGAPVALLARLSGLAGAERVAGSDVFEALRRDPAFSGGRLRIFFFGGRDGAAKAAAEKIAAENRGLVAAGWINPGHGDVEDMSSDAIIDEINAAQPDFLVVALGAAKGQAWIERNKDRLNAPVISHLGAVVDFTAGTIARAPLAWRRLGMEWAWRIKEEPSLWRRYWRDGLALAMIVIGRLPVVLLGNGRKASGVSADAKVSSEDGATLIRLEGDLAMDDLVKIRQAFRAAAAADRPAILDFSAAGKIDAAFLGLVLMLEKNLGSGRLFVRGADARLLRLLAAHGLNYDKVHASAAADASAGFAAAG